MCNLLSDYAFAVMQAAARQCKLPTVNNITVNDLQLLIQEALNVPEKPEEYKVEFQHTGSYTALPVTGGLDSTVLYFRNHQLKTLHTYYVDFGQPYAMTEELALRELCIPYERIRGFDVDQHFWKHIIPARNFYILSLIAERMWGGGKILFGAVDGEIPLRGGDKSQRFFDLMNSVLSSLPSVVSVVLPLRNETKTDLVAWWIDKGLDTAILKKTVSCFSGNLGGHCGACRSCLRKYIAYANNGLELETITDVRVGCVEEIERYKHLMGSALEKSDFSKYSRRRCIQDLAIIEKL